jgi:DNA polymerase elongation subunit (family B)
MKTVVKSQETREGIIFRLFNTENNKFSFSKIEFNNYFFIKTKDYETHKDDFRNKFTFCIEKTANVGQFTQIFFSNNFMRNQVKVWWEERADTYEADIKANKRWLLDHPKVPLNNEKIPYLFYDIETDDRLPLQKDERGQVIAGEAKILSFSGVDNKGEKFYYELEHDYSDVEERKLLNKIINLFANYGVISGWNSEGFDMPYIKQRCDALGVSYKILDYVNHLDYLLLFKKYDKKSRPSFSLNAISNEVLNESKVDQDKGNGAIFNTWKNDPKQLEKYNIEDSNLIYKINQKRSFIEVSMKRADRAHCHVRHTMNNSDSGDYLLLLEYKASNIIMPSKPNKEEVERRKKQGSIGGGHTTCKKPGFYERIDVFDFKSEYPSVIQTWNISPETFVESFHNSEDALKIALDNDYTCTPSDFKLGVYHPCRLYKKTEGVIPRVVRMLVEERDKIKYTMKQFQDSDPEKYRQQYLEQYAIKTDGNSIYGILAFPYSRYYNFDIADSVTTAASATLKECNKEAERQLGIEVVGGDTDSNFVNAKGQDIEKIDKFFIELLDKWAKKWNCRVNKLVFEYEKTFEPFFFVMKKNYAYIMDGKLKIVGMECIKSDSNPMAAKVQRLFVEDVLHKSVDTNEWQNTVEKLYNKVFNQELTSAELTLVKALTKMPSEYEGYVISSVTGKPKVKADGTLQKKAIPAHVKLAERLLEKGKDLYPGSKIKFVVIANKPILAITPEEFDLGEGLFTHTNRKKGEYEFVFEGEYDAKYYWLRIIKPLFKVIWAFYGEVPEWGWNITASERKKMLKGKEDE